MKLYNNSHTSKLKDKYIRRVLKELSWCSSSMYNLIMFDCFMNCGDYDPNIRYAGPNNSKSDPGILESIIPEFDSNFCFYVHDSLYSMIERKILYYNPTNVDWRKRADELMAAMMKVNEPSWLCRIYYRAVRWFGWM